MFLCLCSCCNRHTINAQTVMMCRSDFLAVLKITLIFWDLPHPAFRNFGIFSQCAHTKHTNSHLLFRKWWKSVKQCSHNKNQKVFACYHFLVPFSGTPWSFSPKFSCHSIVVFYSYSPFLSISVWVLMSYTGVL